LSSKDGYGKAALLSFAIVPAENVRHLCWTTEFNVLHGISFQTLPLFSDQGALLATALALTRGNHKDNQMYRKKIILNLHICVIHYKRSTYGPFKEVLKDYESIVHDAIISMSISSSMDEFFEHFYQHLLKIVRQLARTGKELGEAIALVCKYGVFLLRVHPRHWTVFANCPSFKSEWYDYHQLQALYMLTFLGCISMKIEMLVEKFPNKKVDMDSVNKQEGEVLIQEYLVEAKSWTEREINSKVSTYKDIQEFSDTHTFQLVIVF